MEKTIKMDENWEYPHDSGNLHVLFPLLFPVYAQKLRGSGDNQLVGYPLAYLNGQKKNLNVSDLYELHRLRNRFSRFT